MFNYGVWLWQNRRAIKRALTPRKMDGQHYYWDELYGDYLPYEPWSNMDYSLTYKSETKDD